MREDLKIPAAIVLTGAVIALAIFYTYGYENFASLKTDTASVAKSDQDESAEIKIRPVDPNDHIVGDLNASVKLVEYSDTECPFCKLFHPTMKEIMRKYGDKVAWVYRHFPIDQLHPGKARIEAEASECAGELGGNTVFWAFIDKIFEITPSNNQFDLALLPAIAENAGVDKLKFVECLDSGRHSSRVAADWQEAVDSGMTSTPYTVAIAPNGKKFTIVGAQSYAFVSSIVDLALKEK